MLGSFIMDHGAYVTGRGVVFHRGGLLTRCTNCPFDHFCYCTCINNFAAFFTYIRFDITNFHFLSSDIECPRNGFRCHLLTAFDTYFVHGLFHFHPPHSVNYPDRSYGQHQSGLPLINLVASRFSCLNIFFRITLALALAALH